jgi:DNA-binding HxlR family transcriptional regulator/putative sterol carrier protein
MAKRSYDQYCGLARALDLIGERWTLLVVRELLLGPKRYTDLRAGLPGIASNLLADRLEHLEQSGVVRRERLPPPTPATVYRLTERGRALETTIIELGRWGGLALGEPQPGQDFRASWFALGMRATFRARAAARIDADYDFRIGEETFTFHVANGEARAHHGSANSPKLVLEADAETFLALLSGQLSSEQALNSGAANLDGPRRELDRVLHIFRFPADEDSEPARARPSHPRPLRTTSDCGS